MALLHTRVESLESPSWFLIYNRPQQLPPLHPGHPYLPYTIIAVATASEAEPLYFNRIRNSSAYREAYRLPQLELPVQSNTGIIRGYVQPTDTSQRVVGVVSSRSSRVFWRSASLLSLLQLYLRRCFV